MDRNSASLTLINFTRITIIMNKLYHYDPETHAYCGQSIAELDPLEQQPLVPMYATLDVPPEVAERQIAVRDEKNAAWTVQADYRGQRYWLTDGSEHTIDAIGETPPAEALSAAPPVSPLRQKAQVREAIAQATEAARATIAKQSGKYQLATWQDKAQRAARIAADTATEADRVVLEAEIAARGKGESIAELAAKQANKAQAMMTAFATLDGLEAAALLGLDQAEGEAAIQRVQQSFALRLAEYLEKRKAVDDHQRSSQKEKNVPEGEGSKTALPSVGIDTASATDDATSPETLQKLLQDLEAETSAKLQQLRALAVQQVA